MRGWDIVLALAGADASGADALIGLVVDALGVGRFAAAGTLSRVIRWWCPARGGPPGGASAAAAELARFHDGAPLSMPKRVEAVASARHRVKATWCYRRA